MTLKETKPVFQFKQFSISQENANMKLNTDGVLLGAWAPCKNAKTVLDVGTGTGIIALMMAQRIGHRAEIVGIDIDEGACRDATLNADQSPFRQQVSILNISAQNYVESVEKKFDLIVTNPPFFTDSTMPSLSSKAIARHTITLTHADLLDLSKNLLSPKGKFVAILPWVEAQKLIAIMRQENLHLIECMEVYSKPDRPIERLLMCFSREPKRLENHKITLRDFDNTGYTEAYKSLVRDFYLMF